MVALTALAGALAVSLLPSGVLADVSRGLAWATDNRYAPTLGNLPRVDWYHHWQDGPVSTMPGKVEYVPMFWGPKKWDLWNQRVAEMNKKKPAHLLTFNEPDISSQSNMDPNYAAQLFMEQIMPWARKGVKVGSPAIAWNLDWMQKFLNALWSKGGNVDFITVHWYGSWKDINGFKNFIQTTHNRFGYKIWITELGVTSASNPSSQQAKDFMMQAYHWMDQQGYVIRASWFGCFLSSNPPDSYATGKNAFYKAANTLNDMGYWYGYTANPDKREFVSRHARIAARVNANETSVDLGAIEDGDDHCDAICQLRKASLHNWHSENPGFIAAEVPDREF